MKWLAFFVVLVIYWFAVTGYRNRRARKEAALKALRPVPPAGVIRHTDFSREEEQV